MNKESLLNIPMVKVMLDDEHFKFRRRAIDASWYDQTFFNCSLTGFDPLEGCAYVAECSHMSDWLSHVSSSARKFNLEDRLIKEVLFAVHDYLHNWAYRLINHLRPELQFGIGELTDKELENMAFCHVLTEAVATVGLDYWYLSTVDLNEVVPIGTNQKTLTVSFHEKNQLEYLKFNPNLDAQNPKFYSLIAKFYCDGEFPGFALSSLTRSPIIHSWLRHELIYGEDQRKYTRYWLSYLMGQRFSPPEGIASRAFVVRKKWQRDLMSDVSTALWDMVKLGKVIKLKPLNSLGTTWHSKSSKATVDGRFFNLNSVGDDFWEVVSRRDLSPLSRMWLFRQLVSKYKYSEIMLGDIELLKAQASAPNFATIKHILRNYRPIKIKRQEKKDIFLIN